MQTLAQSRPERTDFIVRGVMRLLIDHGYAPLAELPLGNGRRADVAGLGSAGEVIIVECKSCLDDYRVDQKWREYAPYCDAFYFAVAEDFPREAIPEDVGLIVADQFGGAFIRPAAEQPALAPARRRSLLLSYARLAAARLASI
ncbi:MAG: DNA repair putative endonuclease MmcB [Alphaproteobacteria bacterium]